MSSWYGRDVFAALLIVVLCRLTLWSQSNSPHLYLDADLAFYTQVSPESQPSSSPIINHTERIAKPTFLDLDGDGLVDVLISPYFRGYNSTDPWVFRVLDVRPLHRQRLFSRHASSHSPPIPFYPRLLFSSTSLPYNVTTSGSPVHITAAHVPLPLSKHKEQMQIQQNTQESLSKDLLDKEKENILQEIRRKRYYCGRDWQDAITTCAKPCPSGSSIDCPDGEICFADTPCVGTSSITESSFSRVTGQQEQLHDRSLVSPPVSWEPLLHTPHGGVPCVVTLWSDGTLSLQGLSSTDSSFPNGAQHNHSTASQTQLDLHTVWTKEDVFSLAENYNSPETTSKVSSTRYHYEFDNVDVLIEKTMDSFTSHPLDDASIIIVAAHYNKTILSSNDSVTRHYAMIAIDTFSSRILWAHHVPEQDSPIESIHHGIDSSWNKTNSSSARRRSILSYLASQTQSKDEEDTIWSMDCPQEYSSWLHSLPMSFWNRIPTHVPTTPSTTTKRIFSNIMTRSMNGNVERGSIYLSFFQRKHAFLYPSEGQDSTKLMKRHKAQREANRRHGPVTPKKRLDGKTSLLHNVIIYTTRSWDIYVHSLRNGSPVCIIRNSHFPSSLSSSSESVFNRLEIMTPPLVQHWTTNSSFLIPVTFQSRSSNPTISQPLVLMDLVVDSDGMSLQLPWVSSTNVKTISFPQSIIDEPSLLDMNGDGFVDIILVKSVDGYWAYRVWVQRSPWAYSSPWTMFVGVLVLFVGLAVLYNHLSLGRGGIHWGVIRSRHNQGWFGARSSEKDE